MTRTTSRTRRTLTKARRVFTIQERAAIWPRRRQVGLSRAAFGKALAETNRAAFAPPVEAARPDGLAGMIAGALKLCAAVGLPELYAFDPSVDPKSIKAATLLELDEGPRGLTVRLIHRQAMSRHRVEAASDAMVEILEAAGRRVSFRDIVHAPNMGGWRADLRVAPSVAAPRSAKAR